MNLLKIILSRKGTDAAAGGVPSPIFPDGEMASLPIPEWRAGHPSPTRYGDLRTPVSGTDLGKVVRGLSRGQLGSETPAHLDPDLDAGARVGRRPPGWRPLFGQVGAAERHLRNRGVGPGDLFLFFGWFRPVARDGKDGRWRTVPGSADAHVLFGWLQVAERRPFTGNVERELPPWAAGHAHAKPVPYGPLEAVYVATEQLAWPGVPAGSLPGGGLFRRFRPALCLTAPGRTRSRWRLPGWFHPAGRASALSYHGGAGRWETGGDPDGALLLDTAKQGQEFVLDGDHYPEAAAWAAGLMGRMKVEG